MPKTKVKVTGVDKAEAELKATLNKIFRDQRMKDDLVKFAQVTNKADMSKGINSKGKKFPTLKDSTKIIRGIKALNNTVSDLYKRTKSNLHFTGQLKDSITAKSDSSPNKLSISLFLKDSRKPYKNSDGTNAKSTPTNSEIRDKLIDRSKSWDFLGFLFNKKRATQVKNIIRAAIRRRL